MGFRRKWTTVTLCKSARSAIQLFYIHCRKYFAIILNSAVYLSSARVSIFHTLVLLLCIICSRVYCQKVRLVPVALLDTLKQHNYGFGNILGENLMILIPLCLPFCESSLKKAAQINTSLGPVH